MHETEHIANIQKFATDWVRVDSLHRIDRFKIKEKYHINNKGVQNLKCTSGTYLSIGSAFLIPRGRPLAGPNSFFLCFLISSFSRCLSSRYSNNSSGGCWVSSSSYSSSPSSSYSSKSSYSSYS